MKDKKRAVIVTAQHGEKYFGHLPKGVTDSVSYVEKKVADKQPIELHEVMLLASQLQTDTDPRGNIRSVGRFNLLVPVDLLPGPMPKLRLVPSAWYFVSENPEIEEELEQLVEISARNLEQAKKVTAAMRAGITLPEGH